MDLETTTRDLHSIIKRDGRIVLFDGKKIYNAILKAAGAVADREGKTLDEIEAERVTLKTQANLVKRKEFGAFPHSKTNVPDIEDIHACLIATLRQEGHNKTAQAYEAYKEQRDHDTRALTVVKERPGTSATDKALFVFSASQEELLPWDGKRIAFSLMKEANVDEAQAYSIAKETFRRVSAWAGMRKRDNGQVKITTSKIREFANEVIEDLGLERKLRDTNMLSVPVYDYKMLLLGKSKENANITANNPEAVAAASAENLSRQFMLGSVFSPKVADAHLEGRIHAHDLGYAPRVYCSSHSISNLAKWGLELENLSTNSKPAKHTISLIGHLNTFLASMQAYYAGALGVAYINDMLAPYIDLDLEEMRQRPREFIKEAKQEVEKDLEEMVKGGTDPETTASFKERMFSSLDRIAEADKITRQQEDEFIKQAAQYLIFSGSQMAFSRGGQTLFLDFNVHTGTPKMIKENPAIGAGGKYFLRKNGKLIPLEEKVREEKGHLLSELYLGERKVMDEHFVERKDKLFLKRDYNLEEDEKIDDYGEHEETAKRCTRAMLEVWKHGDGKGGVFPFPKCDLHITNESFSDESQRGILDYACQISSENGTPYFIFDREATTLSACCRLRTTIEDDYPIKHLESLRFCGFQNITVNLPRAAFRAGKGNKEEFMREVKDGIELAIDAHLQKKALIKEIGEKGGAQYQTQKLWKDGRPYIDLDKATYIVGLIGMNEAVQYLYGKELHEDPKMIDEALGVTAEMYAYLKQRGKETGLKLSLEESPAESTSRRLAKLDLRMYPEQAREVVKGSIERDEPYYTNSIHLRADAPVSMTDRIIIQSKFHQLIESGAILHVFVGEERPSAKSIYNLVYKTWKDTQAAQLTISPEFTYCNGCRSISPGYKLKEVKING